ncbi:MAG: thiamine-phosphate kinase [Bacteroidales bacterium]
MEKVSAKKEPKKSENINTIKRTQISEIGKQALIDNLFYESGYINRETAHYAKAATGYLTSSKLMLEGIDFDLIYTPLKHLGYKSALLALGLIYAGCYNPKGLSYNLGLSARFCVEDIQEFWSGVLAAAKEHGVENLSLDLNASMTGLTISISATGEQATRIINSFPSVDNTCLLCLTGNVGAAYMGLHVLEREKIAFSKTPATQASNYIQPNFSNYKYILSQYLSPEINPKTVAQFKEAKLFPAAGYFITKGLAASVKQLCNEHGVGAKIYLEKIPIASQTFSMAEELNMDAITAALNGGDDYKFLFAVPLALHEKFHKEFPNIDIIGHLCKPETGALLITPEGNSIEIKAL